MHGVGGVEGVGHLVCMATIYAREIFAAVQPKKVIGSAGILPLGFAACLSKNPAGVSIRICNPINEFLFLTFAAERNPYKSCIFI